LHGRNVALVKGVGLGREHFENTECPPIVAERGHQNGACSEAATAGKVDAGVGFGVVAKENLAGAHALGGKAGVGLETDPKVRRRSTSAGPADDFLSGMKSNGRTRSAGQRPGALSDDVDAGFQVEFPWKNIYFGAGFDPRAEGLPRPTVRKWRRPGCMATDPAGFLPPKDGASFGTVQIRSRTSRSSSASAIA